MKPRRLRTRRWVLSGVLGVALAGLAAPYLSADRFGDRIRMALERSLHRKIEMGAARFRLFGGPGFSLLDVVIHDDPAAGAEPFAYVGSIDARVSLAGLLAGRLEFSSLTLQDPSVNLARTADGPWNFQPLLNLPSAARFPRVAVRGGRLNFKTGGVKSVFYFSNTDFDLNPPDRHGEAFGLEFTGDPTRSDRTARGFGTIRGRGRWRPEPAPAGTLEFDIVLDRTSLGELVTLIYGRDLGVHGQVSGRSRLRGPLSALQVSGTLTLDDIHRWDLLPPYAKGGPLDFQGTLDLIRQNLDLETVPSARAALAVQFRVTDYLAHPQWAASLTMNGLAIPPLVDVARHMGADIARDVRVEGAVSGAVTYTPEEGMQGSISLDGTSIRAPGSPPVLLGEARLVLERDRVRMPPAAVAVGERGQATVQFDYLIRKRQTDLRLATAGMSIAALQSGGGPVPGIPKPAFVPDLRGGAWDGRLAYHREGESDGAWSGALHLRGTQVELPGVAVPLELRSAKVLLRGERVQVSAIEAEAGGLEVGGSYEYHPGAERPHRVALRLASLRGSDLERLMAPTLRPRRGLISRTLRLPRAGLPDWLRDRGAQGSIEVDSLEMAGEPIESVKLDFFWDGPYVDVPRFAARAAGGVLEGHLSVDLRGPEPSFRLGGRLETAAWKGGRLAGDGVISTAGFGEDLRRNLRAEGSFRTDGAILSEDAPPLSLAGAWSVRWDRRRPRVELSAVRLVDGGEVLIGQGGTDEDDRLQVDLTGAGRRMRLAGSLRPLAVSETEARPSP